MSTPGGALRATLIAGAAGLCAAGWIGGGAYGQVRDQQRIVHEEWATAAGRLVARERVALRFAEAAARLSKDAVGREAMDVLQAANGVDAVGDPANAPQDLAKMAAYSTAQTRLEDAVSRLLAAVERPGSVGSLDALANEWAKADAEVRRARGKYDVAARTHNTVLGVFPENLVAKATGTARVPTFARGAGDYRDLMGWATAKE